MHTHLPTCMIADDHALLRDGLRLRLERDGNVQIVGEAECGKSALSMLRELEPQLALLDQSLPVFDGCEVAAVARSEFIPTRIIIMSDRTEPDLLDRAIAAGAYGFVTKDAPSDVLIEALRRAYDGQQFVDPSLTKMLADTGNQLSPREKEILGFVACGYSNAEIARRLVVTSETVKSHVSNVLAKLGAESRTEAVAIALRRSIIQ